MWGKAHNGPAQIGARITDTAWGLGPGGQGGSDAQGWAMHPGDRDGVGRDSR